MNVVCPKCQCGISVFKTRTRFRFCCKECGFDEYITDFTKKSAISHFIRKNPDAKIKPSHLSTGSDNTIAGHTQLGLPIK